MLIPPTRGEQITSIGRLIGASSALAFVELARSAGRPLITLASDPRQADQLEAELRYFAGSDIAVSHFVEWETLPYDGFSPHQDIVSQRLSVMSALPRQTTGIVVVSAPSLLQASVTPSV